MPHYMLTAKYTASGGAGLMKEGAAGRVQAVNALVGSLGGKVEAAYWAFGDEDFVAIVEMPDNQAAAAAALTVSASGAVQVSTTVLLTAEDIDGARSRSATYRPPGA